MWLLVSSLGSPFSRLFCSLYSQPDGYLSEERKASAGSDEGFSTFFSETGMFFRLHYLSHLLRLTRATCC